MAVAIWILWKLAWAIAAIAALFLIYVAGERDASGRRGIGNLLLFSLVTALALWALVHPGWLSLAALYVFPAGLVGWAVTAPLLAVKAGMLCGLLWLLFRTYASTRRYSVAALGGLVLAAIAWAT